LSTGEYPPDDLSSLDLEGYERELKQMTESHLQGSNDPELWMEGVWPTIHEEGDAW